MENVNAVQVGATAVTKCTQVFIAWVFCSLLDIHFEIDHLCYVFKNYLGYT